MASRTVDTRSLYTARASAERARSVAATESPFRISVRFLGGLTETQQSAFARAADRWVGVIVGDLPDVEFDGEVIDDVLIDAQGSAIDGPRGVLGQAGPTHIRVASDRPSGGLPVKGVMSFDTADLAAMESDGTLNDVITHEMGHVLGIGSLWSHSGLVEGAESGNPMFLGPAAMKEYQVLRHDGRARPVPVENTGGPGTFGSHWRESIFKHELMSSSIAEAGNPVSRLTVASLADLGYEVDLEAAEPYTLPNLLVLAESGELVAERPDTGIVLPVIPVELPAGR